MIGSLIARVSRHGNRRVVAFGEKVALLWAEGQRDAALKLERLWNDVVKAYSFALHCAYPPCTVFSQQELADSLADICAEHTEVIAEESFGDGRFGQLIGPFSTPRRPQPRQKFNVNSGIRLFVLL